MNQPTEKHKEEAREIRLPFPCGCLDAHTGGGMTVREYTCETHRAIASALSSRDTEIREVLEGLITWGLCEQYGGPVILHWCVPDADCNDACLAAGGLWERVKG